jgi:HEPN domain-containing protein
MPSDPRDPESWYNFAEKDLARGVARFNDGDFEDSVFRLQQAAEKAMKGKLIGLGWSLEKTHNLLKLSNELDDLNIDVSWFEESADLPTTGYIVERYPGFSQFGPDPESLKKAIPEVTKLFEQLAGRPPKS